MTQPTECPSCGETSTVTWKTKTHQFAYGYGDTQVILSAEVPVGHCNSCELRFTDQRGEEARTAAVNAYLAQHTNGRPWLSREG